MNLKHTGIALADDPDHIEDDTGAPVVVTHDSREAWEEGVYRQLEGAGFTRSDAQGFVEAHGAALESCWNRKLHAPETCELLLAIGVIGSN